MAQMNKLGRCGTKVVKADAMTLVRYWGTDVVKINESKHTIQLNSGGYHTPTTKRRMNQASNQFHLGFTVFSKKGQWWVLKGLTKYPFKDNMFIITPYGTSYPDPHTIPCEQERLILKEV